VAPVLLRGWTLHYAAWCPNYDHVVALNEQYRRGAYASAARIQSRAVCRQSA